MASKDEIRLFSFHAVAGKARLTAQVRYWPKADIA
jgi:hypothetical protein